MVHANSMAHGGIGELVVLHGGQSEPGASNAGILRSFMWKLSDAAWSMSHHLKRISDFVQGHSGLSQSCAWLMGTRYGLPASAAEAPATAQQQSDPVQQQQQVPSSSPPSAAAPGAMRMALTPEAQEELLRDFGSRVWCTYRRDFPALGPETLLGDVGWGCTIRSGQMMMAEVLLRHRLGRAWRREHRHTEHTQQQQQVNDSSALGGVGGEPAPAALLQLLALFLDTPQASLSIHRICDAGRPHGVVPGKWLGPWVLCRGLATLINSLPELQVRVHVVCDPGGGAPTLDARHLLGLLETPCSAAPAPPPPPAAPHSNGTQAMRAPVAAAAAEEPLRRQPQPQPYAPAGGRAAHGQPPLTSSGKGTPQGHALQPVAPEAGDRPLPCTHHHHRHQSSDGVAVLEPALPLGAVAEPIIPATAQPLASASASTTTSSSSLVPSEAPATATPTETEAALKVFAAARQRQGQQSTATAGAHKPPDVRPTGANSRGGMATGGGAAEEPVWVSVAGAAEDERRAASEGPGPGGGSGGDLELILVAAHAPSLPVALAAPSGPHVVALPSSASSDGRSGAPASPLRQPPEAPLQPPVALVDGSEGEFSEAVWGTGADNSTGSSGAPVGSAAAEGPGRGSGGGGGATWVGVGAALAGDKQWLAMAHRQHEFQAAPPQGLVLLLPLTLGVGRANPLYFPQLLEVLTFPQSVGIVGGRPSASLYFVGHQDTNLLYLDPHLPQQAGPLPAALPSYFCDTVRLMPITSMDPSLAIGFYCRDAGELEDLTQRLDLLAKQHRQAPLVTVAPSQQQQQQHTANGSHHSRSSGGGLQAAANASLRGASRHSSRHLGGSGEWQLAGCISMELERGAGRAAGDDGDDWEML